MIRLITAVALLLLPAGTIIAGYYLYRTRENRKGLEDPNDSSN